MRLKLHMEEYEIRGDVKTTIVLSFLRHWGQEDDTFDIGAGR